MRKVVKNPREIPIGDAGFGVVFEEFLLSQGFRTLGDLADCTKEEVNRKDITKRRLGSVRSALAEHGLALVGEIVAPVAASSPPHAMGGQNKVTTSTTAKVFDTSAVSSEQLPIEHLGLSASLTVKLLQRGYKTLNDLAKMDTGKAWHQGIRGRAISSIREVLQQHGIESAHAVKEDRLPRKPAEKSTPWDKNEDYNDALDSDVPSEYTHAQGMLVQNNQRLAYKIAQKYLWAMDGKTGDRALELKDLHQAGRIGLWTAAMKFDPARGYKFSTYATWWVRQAISREVHNGGLVRIPVHMQEMINRYIAIERFQHELAGTPAALEEIRLAMKMDLDDFEKLDKAVKVRRRRKVSLTAPAYADDDKLNLQDILWKPALVSDNASVGAGSYLEDQRAVDLQMTYELMVGNVFATGVLSQREVTVLTHRFGLDGKAAETLEEVGVRFGVTRERIRQLEVKALEKLKDPNLWDKFAEFILEQFGKTLTDEQVGHFLTCVEFQQFAVVPLEPSSADGGEELPVKRVKVAVPLEIRVRNSMLLLESEETVLAKLHGWFGNPQGTPEQVAEEMGVSVERILQTEEKCIKRLKHVVGIEIPARTKPEEPIPQVELQQEEAPTEVEDDPNEPLDPQTLVEAVCEFFRIRRSNLSAYSKQFYGSRDWDYPRKLVLYLLCNRTTCSDKQIADLLDYQRVTRHVSHKLRDVEWWAQCSSPSRNAQEDMVSVIKLVKAKRSQPILLEVANG